MNYDELNTMIFEELKALEQKELDRIYENEKKRQELISRIIWLRTVKDLKK